MVQALIKYKSIVITPAMELVIDEFHDKMTRRDLASKIGVNLSTLKNYLSKKGLTNPRPGPNLKGKEKKKITIVLKGVEKRFYHEAFEAAEQAVKKYR
jgi:DNA-directed RNA polymerase specialized sigma54-like protein